MGSFSIMHWLIVLAVVLVVFGGKGRISSIMADLGKGIRSFKEGLNEEKTDAPFNDAAAPLPKSNIAHSPEIVEPISKKENHADHV
ncbi:MAG: twin-arginine translocase TatA/TatE family subunit [Alphaproteobacteria bacterium]